MKRIMVPLDGSDLAETALPAAAALAQRLGAKLDLAAVVSDIVPVTFESDVPGLASDWLEAAKKSREEYLAEKSEQLRERRPDFPVHTHVRVGTIAKTLMALARELDVDLITLTTHGRGPLKRMWLGSIADQLLRQTAVPLLLLREETDLGSGPRRVLVPLDGSPAAESVLSTLREILPAGASVTLASVVDRPHILPSAYLPDTVSEDALLVEAKKRAEAYLERMAKKLESEGWEGVETAIHEGADVPSCLEDIAKEIEVDLIALSTQGRGAAARLLVGSVADKLIRSSHLPILVAHRSDA